jgi:hypothetical protein
MVAIRRLVLDILKPLEPPIQDVAIRLVACSGIDRVNITLAEMNQKTESIKAVIEGSDIDVTKVRECLESMGAVIHSLDEVDVYKKPVHK